MPQNIGVSTQDTGMAPAIGAGGTGRASDKVTYRLQSYARFADIPFEAANALLLEHAALMHGLMIAGGGPTFDHARHIAAFWDRVDGVLPPDGRFYLAWGPDGRVAGTGSLRRLAGDVGEMKHLYVRPEARGQGLGRVLVERRMEDAREMGLRALVADTVAMNRTMPALYDKLGFQRVPPSETSGTMGLSPELAEHLLYFRLDL